MRHSRSQNYAFINSRPMSPLPRAPYVYTPPPAAWQLTPDQLARQRATQRSIVSRFWITIHPVRRVHRCAAGAAASWHDSGRCPHCRHVDEGFSAWGSNGHQQWTGPDRASLIHYLKLRAKDCRVATRDPYPGALIGTGFKRGGTITYLGADQTD